MCVCPNLCSFFLLFVACQYICMPFFYKNGLLRLNCVRKLYKVINVLLKTFSTKLSVFKLEFVSIFQWIFNYHILIWIERWSIYDPVYKFNYKTVLSFFCVIIGNCIFAQRVFHVWPTTQFDLGHWILLHIKKH